MLDLKRKIDDFLIAWKSDSDRKPLIVKGPRQIGKTESIKHFANNNYRVIAYLFDSRIWNYALCDLS